MALKDVVNRHILDLSPYQPGKPIEELERELGITGSIKLASNESPLGPSPKAQAAIRAAIGGLQIADQSIHISVLNHLFHFFSHGASVRSGIPDRYCQ